MAKIEKITDHAKCEHDTKQWRTYRTWKCKYCKFQTDVYYEDFKNLRAHLRRKHPIEYKPFTIQEEEDLVIDHMSLLRA